MWVGWAAATTTNWCSHSQGPRSERMGGLHGLSHPSLSCRPDLRRCTHAEQPAMRTQRPRPRTLSVKQVVGSQVGRQAGQGQVAAWVHAFRAGMKTQRPRPRILSYAQTDRQTGRQTGRGKGGKRGRTKVVGGLGSRDDDELALAQPRPEVGADGRAARSLSPQSVLPSLSCRPHLRRCTHAEQP